MTLSPNYPNIRDSHTCPLCHGRKAHGRVMCLECVNDNVPDRFSRLMPIEERLSYLSAAPLRPYCVTNGLGVQS